jgi:hypothetical protein
MSFLVDLPYFYGKIGKLISVLLLYLKIGFKKTTSYYLSRCVTESNNELIFGAYIL